MQERTPVLVGVAQLLQREDDPRVAKPPLQLMIEAVRQAMEDAEAPGLIDKVSSIRVIQGIWGYRNPAVSIAEELGATSVETGLSVMGGNHVQLVLNQSALDIQAGLRDVVILCGAECGRTLGRAQKAGLELDWLEGRGEESTASGSRESGPDIEYGDARWTRHEAEMALGIERPVQYYSMFEVALRHHNGESVPGHLDRISKLWARFSEVARDNPSAWIRRPYTAQEIRTLSPKNRPITFPYPLLMNANMRVDMGAALVLCSVGQARALGIPESKMVFPLSGSDASDHYFVSERDNLHSSPAIRIAGARALELAEVEVDELDWIDLYSCFPSAVQVAANELGISQERALTVTGGLTFGGGPLNNYVMHSIARTVELLRANPGGRALVSANGGMLTKHSFGVYGSERPRRGFRHQNVQSEVDRTLKRRIAVDYRGPAEIEAYAVGFGSARASSQPTSYRAIYGQAGPAGDQPTIGYLACRLPDGSRAWATNEDPETLAALCAEELCGRALSIDSAGNASIL